MFGKYCRFGWRRCTEVEKEALLFHYKAMGERMGIKGLEAWKTWDDAKAFQTAYGVRRCCCWRCCTIFVGVSLRLVCFLNLSLDPVSWQTTAEYPAPRPPPLAAHCSPSPPLVTTTIHNKNRIPQSYVRTFFQTNRNAERTTHNDRYHERPRTNRRSTSATRPATPLSPA